MCRLSRHHHPLESNYERLKALIALPCRRSYGALLFSQTRSVSTVLFASRECQVSTTYTAAIGHRILARIGESERMDGSKAWLLTPLSLAGTQAVMAAMEVCALSVSTGWGES